jgi:hypothetical protein
MDLRTVASKVVGEMANSAIPFSGPLAESLVQELLGAQDEQIVLLRGLSDDLNRLLDGPWQTARMYLREAALPRRTPDQVMEALRSASAKLREAAPLQRPGSLLHAHVLVDLAIVERMRGDDDLARHYAADAYVTARSAMGALAQHDYRGRKPDKPDGVARLRASGAVYDQIELAAAVICDPRAPQVLTEDGLGVYFRFDDHAEVKWAAEGPLDFVYIAYFHYLMRFVQEAETRAPTRFGRLDMVWFRFFNPTQVEYPAYPPLPPMVVLEDVGVLVNDLMRLAVMGRLP